MFSYEKKYSYYICCYTRSSFLCFLRIYYGYLFSKIETWTWSLMPPRTLTSTSLGQLALQVWHFLIALDHDPVYVLYSVQITFFFLFSHFFPLFSLFSPSAGTQSGEEIHIVSCSNIKEFKDSFSNEKYDFRSNVNITFFVYVSNFTWPIKIQVCISERHPGDTGGFKLYIGVVS